MKEKNKLFPEKWLLMFSGCAFLFMIIPAWVQGFVWGAAAAVLLCLTVWKLPITPQRIRQLLQQPVIQAVSLILGLGFGCNFYNNWLDSQYVAKIAGVFALKVEWFLLLVAAVVVLLSAPAVTCALSYFTEAARRDYLDKQPGTSEKKRIPAKKAVWLLFAVYAVGISAILRADYLYRDDFGRAAFGYKQWDYFSRFLSTALATLVHGGDYLVDASPMPQLLAMLLMAVAGVMLLYIVYDRTEFSLWELAALIPFGLNPYFLECVSYRFDAPYMAVSVLGAVLPLLFRKRTAIAYVFASMLGILAVCTSYQAATGIFPMLVIFLMLRMWNERKPIREILAFCLRSVAGYVLGLLFFLLVLMRPADAGYVSNSLPAVSDLLENTLSNLLVYYQLVGNDFRTLWLVLTVLAAVAFLVEMILGSRQKKPAALAVTAVGLVLMGLLCFGIYPVLAEPVTAPRAMYGFGVLITIFGVAAAEREKKVFPKLPVLILSWIFIVFSFTYGNALCAQKEYTDFRISLVMQDLNEMEVFRTGDPVTVQVTGSIGKAPILRNMPQDYQMLNRLVPKTFGGSEDWEKYGFYYYYGLKNVVWDPSVNLKKMDLPILKETSYHIIRGEGNYVWVRVKK